MSEADIVAIEWPASPEGLPPGSALSQNLFTYARSRSY